MDAGLEKPSMNAEKAAGGGADRDEAGTSGAHNEGDLTGRSIGSMRGGRSNRSRLKFIFIGPGR
jgi:hypothetical protein